ncbi:putative transmembrane sensor domain protein [Cylindrospermum stagnale PCC 7417]|uniref:Putative transmembrane sensor domain protein n=1 Tax=Cylindrospermum stagnale PCC 7417 TaxID=56107 RepID=K9X349_9NOST|nr:CHASE2 domain-containing protein [Cylindrospermum stagnale]AFZ26107.1 putative transmembrane sensor domain protein [Cylindrospermum stagnale PCC 7417]
MTEATQNQTPESIEVFFSYSREDEELRKKLTAHLSALEREKVITAWHDREISAGTERDEEIEKHLNSARVILLLISADFIASEDNWQRDVKRAMERHKVGEARVIPVLVRECDWEGTPFSKLEPLPSNRKAIGRPDNDEAFTDVAKGIRKAVKEMTFGQQQSKDTIQLAKGRLLKIPWINLRNLLLRSMGITVLVVVMRWLAILQASELYFFDQMMRMQPIEEQDNRLLVIEITKKDIDSQDGTRQGSLTDETLLNILKTLLKNPQNQPRVIGIDLYRDFETKTPDLSSLLEKNPLIFGLCNAGDDSVKNDGVAPIPELPSTRLGFSDFLADSDGIIRRQLLSMEIPKGSPCLSKVDGKFIDTAFGFRLAQRYLNQSADDLLPKFKLLDASHGGSFFTLLENHLEGDQVLLNYRISCSEDNKTKCSPEFVAPRVTVGDVLKPDFLDRYSLKDKIVLIGLNEYSYELPVLTPFSSATKQPVPGVIVQAQMISQILSAVEGKRPLLQVWSIWYEIVWIFGWSLLGGTLAQFYRSKRKLIFSGGIAFTSLYIICLVLFNLLPMKRWVPFVPPALTFLGTGVIVVFIRIQEQ